MQLTPLLAQPPSHASAGLPRFTNILTTLRAERPPVEADVPTAAPTVVAEEPQASFAATILGNAATSQNRYLANQQLLGALSAELGARFTHLARSVWSMLRDEAPRPADQQAQPAQ